MTDSFFIHPQHRNRISTIYPATTFHVHIEDPNLGMGVAAGAGHPRTQAFNISVEQLSSNELLVNTFEIFVLEFRVCKSNTFTANSFIRCIRPIPYAAQHH